MHNSSAKLLAKMLMAAGVMFTLNQAALAEVTHATIMPKADRSLLLDIEQEADKLVVVGERGHILISADQGKTWQQKPVPTAQMLNGVFFVDTNNGWAVGHDGNIVASNDGGETWVLQRDGLQAQKLKNENAFKEAKAKLKRYQRLAERGAESDGEGNEVAQSIDDAEYDVKRAQEAMHETTIAPPLMDVWFADKNNGFAVGAFGTLLATKDGGETWLDESEKIADSIDGYHLNSVAGDKKGLVVIVGEGGYLAVSHDVGATWQAQDPITESSLFGVAINSDSSLIVATGLRGTTLRSTDGGKTFAEITVDVGYSLANASVQGQQVLLVGAGGTLALSDDAGEHFSYYTLPSRVGLSQGIILSNKQLLLVGQGGIHRFEPSASTKE